MMDPFWVRRTFQPDDLEKAYGQKRQASIPLKVIEYGHSAIFFDLSCVRSDHGCARLVVGSLDAPRRKDGFMYAVQDLDTFAELIARWRRLRGMSQEQLGEHIGQSQRHISFIENARTRPSSITIKRIAIALSIPPRDGNRLLNLVGHADTIAEPEPDWAEMPVAYTNFASLMIRGVAPQPAAINDMRRRSVRMNLMQAMWLSRMNHLPEFFDDGLVSFPRALFHPHGLRLYLDNWEEVAENFLQVLHRIRLLNPDLGQQIYEDILSLADLPKKWRIMSDGSEGTTGIIMRPNTILGPICVRFMTFEMGAPAEQPIDRFSKFFVTVNMPVDKKSHDTLTEIWKHVKIEDVHESLLPSLVHPDIALPMDMADSSS